MIDYLSFKENEAIFLKRILLFKLL